MFPPVKPWWTRNKIEAESSLSRNTEGGPKAFYSEHDVALSVQPPNSNDGEPFVASSANFYSAIVSPGAVLRYTVGNGNQHEHKR